jgi:hypothetical protein
VQQIVDCGGVGCAGTIRRPRAIRRRAKVKEASSRSVGGPEAAGAERSMIFLTTRSCLRAHYHYWHAACMQLAARRQTPGQGWATGTWGHWMGRRDGAWVHACVARVGEGEKVSATSSPPVSARRLPSSASTERRPARRSPNSRVLVRNRLPTVVSAAASQHHWCSVMRRSGICPTAAQARRSLLFSLSCNVGREWTPWCIQYLPAANQRAPC